MAGQLIRDWKERVRVQLKARARREAAQRQAAKARQRVATLLVSGVGDSAGLAIWTGGLMDLCRRRGLGACDGVAVRGRMQSVATDSP